MREVCEPGFKGESRGIGSADSSQASCSQPRKLPAGQARLSEDSCLLLRRRSGSTRAL